MSFESATEFAGWTLSFGARQIRRRKFACRSQPDPALAVSKLIESVDAGNVQNTRATRDHLPLSRTGAQKMLTGHIAGSICFQASLDGEVKP